jgi:hypothetical protein
MFPVTCVYIPTRALPLKILKPSGLLWECQTAYNPPLSKPGNVQAAQTSKNCNNIHCGKLLKAHPVSPSGDNCSPGTGLSSVKSVFKIRANISCEKLVSVQSLLRLRSAQVWRPARFLCIICGNLLWWAWFKKTANAALQIQYPIVIPRDTTARCAIQLSTETWPFVPSF